MVVILHLTISQRNTCVQFRLIPFKIYCGTRICKICICIHHNECRREKGRKRWTSRREGERRRMYQSRTLLRMIYGMDNTTEVINWRFLLWERDDQLKRCQPCAKFNVVRFYAIEISCFNLFLVDSVVHLLDICQCVRNDVCACVYSC